ncbi:hypothetical protein D3C72_627590 [compost metagenome]
MAEQKPDSSVSLKFKKTYPKRLISTIVNNNNALLQETDEHYIVSAPYIRVVREEVESVLGKLTEAKWRLLFIGRSTDKVRDFDSSLFSMGNQRTVLDKSELTQVNFSIPKTLKAEMTTYRSEKYLNLGQNEFVTEALREYIDNIKREAGE